MTTPLLTGPLAETARSMADGPTFSEAEIEVLTRLPVVEVQTVVFPPLTTLAANGIDLDGLSAAKTTTTQEDPVNPNDPTKDVHPHARFRRPDGTLPRLAGGAPDLAVKEGINDKLTTVEKQIDDLRNDRAAVSKRLETAKAALARVAGKVDADSPEFVAAKDAAREEKELDAQIEKAQHTQIGLLELLGQSPGAPRAAGDGSPAADPIQTAALKNPGAWLASALEKRKGSVSTIPESLRMMAAPSSLTTAHVSEEAESEVLIDLLAPLSVAMSAGIVAYPIDGTKTNIPRFTDMPVASWVAELGSFPKNAPGLEMVEVQPPKVGLVSPLSVEVFEDLSPLALSMVQVQILRAVGLAYDQGILFGDGTDATPLGVAHTPGITEVSAPLTGIRPFAEAIAELIGSNAFPGALVMNPIDLGELFMQTEWISDTGESNVPLWQSAIRRAANGAFALNLPYFGVPIWPTPAAPQGEALLFDPSTIIAVLRRAADIALDPFYGFDTGEVGFRCYLRGDVVVGQPEAAVHIALTPGS